MAMKTPEPERHPQSYKGRLNIYTCDTCRGHIVTKDLDDGVTPFLIPCYCRAGCRGKMQSSVYRVSDQSMAHSHEWYHPTVTEMESATDQTRAHVRQGGLLLRPVAGFIDHREMLRRYMEMTDLYLGSSLIKIEGLMMRHFPRQEERQELLALDAENPA